jgi:polygalacturonase
MAPMRRPRAILFVLGTNAFMGCGPDLSVLEETSDSVHGLPAFACDVRDYGARGDGRTKNTEAIRKAIEACAGRGGTVYFRQGTYLTGTIELKSNMVFHIDATATLRGTQDDRDYPRLNPPTDNTQLMNCRKSLVYAERVENIRIEGGGTIDGNGNKPDWVYPRAAGKESKRPMAIYTALSRNITIRDIKVKDAAMWGVVNLEAENLRISNIHIDSMLPGNRDGIDIVDCHHVVIENSTIFSQDDAICLKTGSKRGVDDVVVRNCHVGSASMANALKLGTASYGFFRNITFEDIRMEGFSEAAMAVESVDGAEISNVTFRRIDFRGAGSGIFLLLGDRGLTPKHEPHRIGSIHGVRFEDITGTVVTPRGSLISGTRLPGGAVHKVDQITLERVRITGRGGLSVLPKDPPEYMGQYPQASTWGDLPAFGYFIRHADHVTFERVATGVSSEDARRAIETRDAARFANH